MSKIKYLYISSLKYDGSVYQTQILDWLDLYRKKGLPFELVHHFSIGRNKRLFNKQQKQILKQVTNNNVSFGYFFEHELKWKLLNCLLFRLEMRKFRKYDKIVILSRADIGWEIESLKKAKGDKIIYYYDLRGAVFEEALLNIKANRNYSQASYSSLGQIGYSEYLRQKLANKIFVVSNALKRYFVDTYHSNPEKFVAYPCLSSSEKFYYSDELRSSTRKELGFEEKNNVYVYSGGIVNSYHIPEAFLKIFEKICVQDDYARLLIIAKQKTKEMLNIIQRNDLIKDKIIIKEAVPNKDVVKYLNAADFGFLIRDNIIVNNVASPSKYAEYILCGLPTIISESLHDWAEYCKKHNAGYILSNADLLNLDECMILPLNKNDYNREAIATEGITYMSKEGAVDGIVEQLKVE